MKCELCEIECDCTRHHLVPKLKAKNKYKEIKDDPTNILYVCRSCHDQIHSLFTETELRDLYFTKSLLLENDEFRKFVEWKKKHPNFTGHSKMSNRKRY
jgi:hypothetical protein